MTRRKPLPQLVRERIQARWDELGISAAELARRCGLKDYAVSQFKSGVTPALDRLEQFASGLGVPPSYLVSEDEPAPALAPGEQRLVDHYRMLPEPEQARVQAFAEGLAATTAPATPATPPDPNEAALLDWYRQLDEPLRTRARTLLEGMVAASR